MSRGLCGSLRKLLPKVAKGLGLRRTALLRTRKRSVFRIRQPKRLQTSSALALPPQNERLTRSDPAEASIAVLGLNATTLLGPPRCPSILLTGKSVHPGPGAGRPVSTAVPGGGATSQMWILPSIAPARETWLAGLAEGEQKRRTRDDESTVGRPRDFLPTESCSRLHWSFVRRDRRSF